jgi:hypothetical protein
MSIARIGESSARVAGKSTGGDPRDPAVKCDIAGKILSAQAWRCFGHGGGLLPLIVSRHRLKNFTGWDDTRTRSTIPT